MAARLDRVLPLDQPLFRAVDEVDERRIEQQRRQQQREKQRGHARGLRSVAIPRHAVAREIRDAGGEDGHQHERQVRERDLAPDRRAGDEERRQHPPDRHEQPLPPRQAIDAPAGHRDAEDQDREPQRDRLEHDQRHQQREPRRTPGRQRQAQQIDRGVLDRVADDGEDAGLDHQHEHAGDHLRDEAADARAEALGGIAALAAQAAGVAPHGSTSAMTMPASIRTETSRSSGERWMPRSSSDA